MTTRPSRVYADAYTTTTFPQRITGEDDVLRLRDAVQMVFLKWRDPWDDDAVVSVGSQVLELTVKGASTGARTLTARAVASGWTDSGIKDANKPGVTGVTNTKDIGTLAEGDVVQVPITGIAQAHAADGGKNRGIRLVTTATATHEFYSADSPYPPRVVTTWTEQPTAPTLTPAGGVVSVPKWAVKFGDLDVDGDLSALQLQVDPAANGTTPGFDTGTVAATEGLLDLATHSSARSVTVSTTLNSTAITAAAGTPLDTIRDKGQAIAGPGIPAGATLADVTSATAATLSAVATATGSGVAATITRAYLGLAADAVTQMRGRATIGGVASDWSPWYTIGHRPQRTLVFDSPAGGVVTSTTPVILATYNGANAGAEALKSYQLQVFDSTGEVLRYDTGRKPATSTNQVSEEIPDYWVKRLMERVLRKKGGAGYLFVLRAWGGLDRVSAPGARDYAEVTKLVTVDHDALLAAPTGLTATTLGEGVPGLRLAWTISPDAPDKVAVATSNDEIVAILTAVDVNTGGTSYAWDWASAPPYLATTVKVAKIVDGKLGPWSTTASGTSKPEGVWVVSEKLGVKFHLAGLDVDNWTYTDQGISYQPSGSPHRVFVTTSQQGLSGTFVGDLRAIGDLTYDQQLAAVHKVKERPNTLVEIVAGDLTFPARLTQLSPGPHPEFREGQEARLVALEFDQRGGLPFTSRLSA